jgi:(R,R)-butanediol dehydrogenase / meso-butanediol dehydrogenase / diacetyl reductase
MKAAVYQNPGKITVMEKSTPKAMPGEVVVKIKYCGICGTDTHIYQHGQIAPAGIILGHENVGVISEVGTGVTDWKAGDRVICSAPGPCGKCYYCRTGQPNSCLGSFEKTNGPRRDGGMAEFMLVKEPQNMLFRIPDSVSFEDAVLFDIVCVALKGIRISKFHIGDNVVVAGAGAIGLSAIQLLRMGGAGHITVLQPSAKKREMALKSGADLAINPGEETDKIEQRIKDMYNGIGADVTFECAGSVDAFQWALKLARKNGQAIILGHTTEPAPVVSAFLILQELDIKFSHVYSHEEIYIYLNLLNSKRFKTEGMVSDIIKLEDVVEKGFERLIHTKGLVKVLVAP